MKPLRPQHSESVLALLHDARQARKLGRRVIAQQQCRRLADLVAFARSNSPYYQELYQELPARVADATLLPVTRKQQMMPRFADWVTDRDVTLGEVQAVVETPERIGEPFLGKYTVATTSGTTGTRGIFLLDNRSLRVTSVLALRMLSDWLTAGDVLRILIGRGRLAMVMATGGHFASTSVSPSHSDSVCEHGALLASEQETGRLDINPALVVLSAEGLALPEYDRIARAFHATVRHSYAATECPFLSYSCAENWLHVNSDWVILEPVDAAYHPTPPGIQSHTVLITNLANRVQPMLRYDLGDSVLQRIDPCPCGNPLPAIRVQGRAADILTFLTAQGTRVAVAPLAFGNVMDRTAGIELWQIVQTAPTQLRVRLRVAAGADQKQVWRTVRTELTRLLADHGLDQVTLERGAESPEQSAGGKYREVIPLDRRQETGDAPWRHTMMTTFPRISATSAQPIVVRSGSSSCSMLATD